MAFELPKGEEYKDMRRNLYEQLINHPTIVFDPNKHPRDAQLQEEFGPPEVFRETLTVEEEAAPVSEENQYINWAMDAFPDPTQEEYDKAAGQIARKEQFLDRGFERSETIGINRLNRMLGPDVMEEETTVETPEVDSTKSAVFQESTLPGTAGSDEDRPDEPSELEQKIFGSKTTEQKKEEELLKDPKPEPDPMEDVEIVEEEVVEEPGSMSVNMKQTDGYLEGKNIVSISDPYGYGLETYDGVIDKLMELQDIYEGDEFTEGSFYFFETEKQNYINLANDIKKEIDTYEDSINAIAEEKPGPALSGANKFWAVIAAALGAGASSITGTPNFAMQIINKTIDQHLEKFKDDRDFRQKSAERQQLNLIQERGRMLQMAQNASDSALASLKNRAAVESQIATVEGIKSGIIEARERGDQQMVLALQTLMFKQYQAVQESKKEFGDKYVPGLGVTSIKDAQGIKDALKEGRKMIAGVRTIEEQRERALKIFEEVGTANLLAQSAAGIRKAQGKDYIKLRTIVGSLWGVYKNDIMKGGAALTPTEKTMINRVIPEEDIFTIGLGELKTALEVLPNDYESRLKGFQQANQFVPVTPVDYGFVQEGMPPKGMPRANRIPKASDLGGSVRNAGG